MPIILPNRTHNKMATFVKYKKVVIMAMATFAVSNKEMPKKLPTLNFFSMKLCMTFCPGIVRIFSVNETDTPSASAIT